MQASALKNEAISLFDSLSESKLLTVIQFVRFIAQQPKSDFSAASREERELHDIEWINANADRLNAEVEKSLEFQADLWEDEE